MLNLFYKKLGTRFLGKQKTLEPRRLEVCHANVAPAINSSKSTRLM